MAAGWRGRARCSSGFHANVPDHCARGVTCPNEAFQFSEILFRWHTTLDPHCRVDSTVNEAIDLRGMGRLSEKFTKAGATGLRRGIRILPGRLALATFRIGIRILPGGLGLAA